MNQLWVRATQKGLLKSLYDVLKRELEAMESEKKYEIAKFVELASDEAGLQKYRTDSGLTKDICERILSELKYDLKACNDSFDSHPEQNALDGERDLKSLYCIVSQVPIVWTAKDGQKPVDLIVLGAKSEEILLGDCKFGLKSESAWILRKEKQFTKEFSDKFDSVGNCVMENDGVASRHEMLLIVTSALAPLLKNRIDDFKLDSECAGIPYDKIKICSVEDIYSVCQELLPGFVDL